MISLLHAHFMQSLKFLNLARGNSIEQIITIIQFQCNEGMDNAIIMSNDKRIKIVNLKLSNQVQKVN